mmetsp:Transcript_9569/g.35469  ORF Transcript_9569/g.35469 Transcript_9569/m.35469 type:complete len:595 (+) Transcript_9569:169-1953(+)
MNLSVHASLDSLHLSSQISIQFERFQILHNVVLLELLRLDGQFTEKMSQVSVSSSKRSSSHLRILLLEILDGFALLLVVLDHFQVSTNFGIHQTIVVEISILSCSFQAQRLRLLFESSILPFKSGHCMISHRWIISYSEDAFSLALISDLKCFDLCRGWWVSCTKTFCLSDPSVWNVYVNLVIPKGSSEFHLLELNFSAIWGNNEVGDSIDTFDCDSMAKIGGGPNSQVLDLSVNLELPFQRFENDALSLHSNTLIQSTVGVVPLVRDPRLNNKVLIWRLSQNKVTLKSVDVKTFVGPRDVVRISSGVTQGVWSGVLYNLLLFNWLLLSWFVLLSELLPVLGGSLEGTNLVVELCGSIGKCLVKSLGLFVLSFAGVDFLGVRGEIVCTSLVVLLVCLETIQILCALFVSLLCILNLLSVLCNGGTVIRLGVFQLCVLAQVLRSSSFQLRNVCVSVFHVCLSHGDELDGSHVFFTMRVNECTFLLLGGQLFLCHLDILSRSSQLRLQFLQQVCKKGVEFIFVSLVIVLDCGFHRFNQFLDERNFLSQSIDTFLQLDYFPTKRFLLSDARLVFLCHRSNIGIDDFCHFTLGDENLA